ncbi:NAD(P)-dependent oxidoreductase [Kitasatospora sp. NPDC096147]|uniref:NAD(P)-dependent oxidoreductase n=1 Tax=Kitasatospora sp. NPDC096147 TaxID=3364093 RepID=UPI0037F37A5E
MTARHPARLLVVDTAPPELAVAELAAFEALGLQPVVNLRRLTDPALRERIAGRWPVLDFDGFDAAQLASALEDGGRGFDALKCRAGIPLDRTVLGRATAPDLERRLTLAGRAASGSETFDRVAAEEAGVTLLTTPGANAAAVAELTLALALDALRGVARRSAALHAGDWAAAVTGLPTTGLAGARFGVVGTGAVARQVALLARAFGAEVLAHGSERFTAERAAGWPGRRIASLAELLTECEVVSVHVPATAGTAGLIGEAELRLMRPGSVLVNTARASVVDEAALDRVLRDPSAGPAAAGVDVFDREGPGHRSPLAGNPYCTLSPHAAGMTRSAMREASRRLVDAFAAELARGPGPGPVSAEGSAVSEQGEGNAVYGPGEETGGSDPGGASALGDLVHWRGGLEGLLRATPGPAWSGALVRADRAGVADVLGRLLAGRLPLAELPLWAESVHLHDGVELGEDDAVIRFLVEASSPEIFEPITPDFCRRWLAVIGPGPSPTG